VLGRAHRLRARRAALVGSLGLVALAAGAPSASATAPAEHDCFWLGPISMKKRSAAPERFDGHLFNFPEESATYWLARYRLQPGQKLVLRGRYPHARYESLNSYVEGGTPVFSLPDVGIRPDRGSTNPFIAGARRDGTRRTWTVTVVDQPAPGGGAAPNTVYAPSTPSFASELVLRVYEPDRGRDLTGGVGLPKPEIVNADGSTVRGLDPVCGTVNDPDRSIDSTVQRIPASLWTALVNTPGPTSDPATAPAMERPQWERFFNQQFSAGVFQQAAGNPRPLGGQADTGGFYSNRDTRYVLTHLSRKFGKVVLIHARMPVFPQTHGGRKRMPRAQLRFWSLCSGESRVTTRTPDCLADRQVPLDGKRDYTIVVTKRADRPRNARRACGIAWLDWGRNGDGAGRPDYALLLMRNMLPSPTFRRQIQNIQRFGEEQDMMGPYFPRTSYTSKRAIERRGCPAHGRA
jgi:hypothetical protein